MPRLATGSPRGARGALLAALAFALAAPALGVASPPNFIVIVVDDQHWNGTSVAMDPARPDSRNAFSRTPNLEALAGQGMRFSSAYATPLCRPTQLTLHTGKSPARLQITTNSHQGFGRPLSPPLPRLNPWMPSAHPGAASDLGDPRVRREDSLARRLVEAVPGYRTAHFGKYAEILRGWAFYDEGLRAGDLPPEVDPKSMFTFTRRAIAFMRESVTAERPFFVTLTHNAVKPPVETLPRTLARWQALDLPWPTDYQPRRYSWPSYSAMTEDLDTTVGMILDELRALGIGETTYVIYTSDNGRSGVAPATHAPLRRGKGTLYEGGIRVPLLISGPRVAANAASRVPVSLTDLFPTILELAAPRYPLEAAIDGASLVPVFANRGRLPAGTTALRRPFGEAGELYFRHTWPERESAAVIAGDRKLLRFYTDEGERDELYDLAADISETTDLAAKLPHEAADLGARLDRWLAGVEAPLPYRVEARTELLWSAGDPGRRDDVELAVLRASLGTSRPRSDLDGDGRVDRADEQRLLARLPWSWRSTLRVAYKDRETWFPSRSGAAPERVAVRASPPGLPGYAFRFDGEQGLERMFFHVSDPTRDERLDDDHSVTFAFWLRLASPARPGMILETGDRRRGLSLTLGDGDADGQHDEVRLRARGTDGWAIAVTAELDPLARATRDFVHLVAVIDDSDGGRQAALYVNGELAAAEPGPTGRGGRIDWDGDYSALFEAGLGRPSGELGGAGGEGPPPFSSDGFAGEIAQLHYYNYAIDAAAVRAAYRRMLAAPDAGIPATESSAAAPPAQ